MTYDQQSISIHTPFDAAMEFVNRAHHCLTIGCFQIIPPNNNQSEIRANVRLWKQKEPGLTLQDIPVCSRKNTCHKIRNIQCMENNSFYNIWFLLIIWNIEWHNYYKLLITTFIENTKNNTLNLKNIGHKHCYLFTILQTHHMNSFKTWTIQSKIICSIQMLLYKMKCLIIDNTSTFTLFTHHFVFEQSMVHKAFVQ